MATKVRNGKIRKVGVGETPKDLGMPEFNRDGDRKDEKFVPYVLQSFESDHLNEISDLSLYEVNINDIKERDNNNFIKSKIEELATSIKSIGLKQPIVIKSIGRDDEMYEKFEVVAGHRRLAAYKILNEKYGNEFLKINAIILNKDEEEKDKEIYLETNSTSRNITLYEALLNCDLDEIDFNNPIFKDKYNQMLYPDGNVSKKEKYDNNSIIKYLEETIKQNFPTIEDVKVDTVRKYYYLIRNSCDELTKAILDGKVTMNQAKSIVRVNKEKQPAIIEEIISGTAVPKMDFAKKNEEKPKAKDSYKEMLKIDNRLRNCLKVDLSIIETDDWTPNTIAYYKQMKKALAEIEKLEAMPKK